MPEEYVESGHSLRGGGGGIMMGGGAGGAGAAAVGGGAAAAGEYGLASHLMAHGDGPVDVSEFMHRESPTEGILGGGGGGDSGAAPAAAAAAAAAAAPAASQRPAVAWTASEAPASNPSRRPPAVSSPARQPPAYHHQPQGSPVRHPHQNRLAAAAAAAAGGGGGGGRGGNGRARSAPRQRPFNRRTKEDVRREVELAYQQECTFRPRINSKKKRNGQVLETREERMQRLAAPQNEIFAKRERADQRAMERERAKRQLEEAELESFPFQPSINPHTAAILDMTRYRPIHERVGDLQRAKNAELQRRRIEQEKVNPDLTFRPEISAESERLVHRRRLEAEDPAAAFNVTERLVRDAASQGEKKNRRAEAWQDKEAAEHRFRPTLTERTQQIVAESGDFQEGEDFLERNRRQVEKKKKKEDMARAAAAKEDDERCKFKPDIGASSDLLQQSQPHRMNESEMEMIERLSKTDKDRRSKQKDAAR
eukprot:g4059.t1